MARGMCAALTLVFVIAMPARVNAKSGHHGAATGCGSHGAAGHASASGAHAAGVAAHQGTGTTSHFHGGGGGYHADAHRYASTAVDRELHERVVKTEKAKAEFRGSHPCPVSGVMAAACRGYAIECIDPNPADPSRCLDPAHMEWRPVEPAGR